MRGVIVDDRGYDWEGDEPLQPPMSETIIYEMHVRGFTRSPTSGVEHPGTFSGVIEKIPYLKELGVTAVELLPVFEFDEREVARDQPDRRRGAAATPGATHRRLLRAAARATASARARARSIAEFRDMVKALHKAGIEVILDVVFNHTGEGNHDGPDDQLPGPRQQHLLPAGRPTSRSTTWTSPAAATR